MTAGVVMAVVMAVALVSGVAGGVSGATTCLVSPTSAPIVDPFRAPACPWCRGNRGIEYATAPGDPLAAMADGVVTFAGAVAGVRYVTIMHAAGDVVVRSTFGGVAEILVAVGERVAVGQVIALAGGPTLVTVRVRDTGDGHPGDVYVDPAPLIGRPTWRPRLVPRDGTPARPPRAGPVACG